MMNPKQPGTNGMKGPHPDVVGLPRQHVANPLPHFACRFVGKRDGKNSMRLDTVSDQSGDTMHQHPGFSGACSGKHHKRAFFMIHCSLLLWIQKRVHDLRLKTLILFLKKY